MSVRIIIIITAHDAMCTMRSKEELSEIIKIHQVLARNRLSLSLVCTPNAGTPRRRSTGICPRAHLNFLSRRERVRNVQRACL